MRALINEDLERVMRGFSIEDLGQRDYATLETRVRTWTPALRGAFETGFIETLVYESYLYIERKEFWVDYLSRQMSKKHRSQVLDVLKSWKNPMWLLAEVVDQKEKVVYLHDELSSQEYTIDSEKTAFIGDWLFGIAIPDFRNGTQMLQGTECLLYIPKNRKDLFQALLSKLKTFDGDVLGLYSLLSELREKKGLSTFEQDVLTLVKGYFKTYNLSEGEMIKLGRYYLINTQVNAKKPGAVAAGLIQSFYDLGFISTSLVSQKELVGYFDVSIGTMNKYRNSINDFIISLQQPKGITDIVMDIGTDPRGTEQSLWEMVIRTSRQEFASQDELNTMIQGQMNAKFEPLDNKERAQLLCYEAYEAKSDKERIQLTQKAAMEGSKVADVQLLLSEQTSNELEKKNYFLQAIIYGIRKYDNSFEDAWGYVLNRPYLRATFTYGAWLMEQELLEEAAAQFNDILKDNPKDHQGVRWLLVSIYLRSGQIQLAEKMLEQASAFQNKTLFHYFKTVIEIVKGNAQSSKVSELLNEAQTLNPRVMQLLKENKDPGAFPRKLILQPGNEDEARYVYWLIYGLME